MSAQRLAMAIVHEVFPEVSDRARLTLRLHEARQAGAALAVLPELPLDHWAPATRTRSDADAEPPGGPRARAQAAAAASAGVALLGGAIVRDPHSGRRHNTALLFDRHGTLRGCYRKLHLPDEPGFWEAQHYEPGDDPPRPLAQCGFSLGVQICSDANRPEGARLLAALGVDVILVPRATPLGSYDRWRCVLRATAITSCAFVVSINRPHQEGAVDIGGPSLAIAPDGEVLAESIAPLTGVTLERARLDRARADYPGYLAHRTGVFARGWQAAKRGN